MFKIARLPTLFLFFASSALPSASAQSIQGVSQWTLVSFTDAQGTVRPTGDLVPNLRWLETGQGQNLSVRLSGFGGCNGFGAKAVVNVQRGTVKVSELIATQKGCQGEAGTLEPRLLRVLNAATRFSRTPDQLVLRAGNARAVFTLETAHQNLLTLLKTPWTLLEGGNGQQTLRLDENLRASGSTGCNTFNASFKLEDANDTATAGKLSFGPLATTRRACSSAAATQLEREFLSQLEAVRAYALAGNRLTLTLEGGEKLEFGPAQK